MRIFFLLLISLVLTACSTEKKDQIDLVIQNGNIIDLETGALLQQTLFVKDGRIIKVGTLEDVNSYEVKNIIDADGKYILPGFWDNHVHFRGGDSLIAANKNFLKLFLANGITTVRDAGGDLTKAVVQWNKAIGQGDLIGPTIFTSGPKIDGPNGTWAGSLEVESEKDIAIALDSLQQIPTDFIKLYDSKIDGDLYLKTIAEAEKRNLITSGHMPFTVSLNQTVDAGIDAIEHLYYVMKGCAANEKEVTEKLHRGEIGFWDAMPLLLENYQDSTAQKSFAKLKQHNVFIVPTLHIGKTLSYLDEVDHSTDEYLKYMTKGILKTYEGRINRAKNSSPNAIADRKDLDQFFGRLSKSLNDAGVQLLAGSDSGAFNSYTYPGISLHMELEELVANGISPLQALRTSAYNGAKFLKKDENYGDIAKGKIADLVILDANPLNNIQNTRQIFMLVKTRKVHSREDLNAMLEAAKKDAEDSFNE